MELPELRKERVSMSDERRKDWKSRIGKKKYRKEIDLSRAKAEQRQVSRIRSELSSARAKPRPDFLNQT